MGVLGRNTNRKEGNFT